MESGRSLSTEGLPSLLALFCAAPVWDSLTGSANRALEAPPEEEAEEVVGISFGFFGRGAPLDDPAPPPPEVFD